MPHILPKLFLLAGLSLTLGACGDGNDGDGGDASDAAVDESFTYELLVNVSGQPNMQLAIGGEALIKNEESSLSFTYTREFTNVEEAENPLDLDIVIDGGSAGSILTYPAGCRSTGCESFDRALHTLCISENGERVDLCGQLQCSFEGVSCGGYIE